MRPLTAFSKDGEIAASVIRGNRMKWWKVDAAAKDAEIFGFVGKNVVYTTLCFARVTAESKEVVVVGTEDGLVEVFDLAGGKVSSSKPFESLGHKGAVSSVSSTEPKSKRPGSIFVSSEQCPQVAEVSLEDGSLRSSFKADKMGVRRVVVSDEYILTASTDKLRVYNYDHERIATYPIGAMRAVTSLCSQGSSVAVSDGSTAFVWDITRNTSHAVKGDFTSERLEDLQFSPSAKWLCGRSESSIILWQATVTEELTAHRHVKAPSPILGMAVKDDDSLVAMVGDLKRPRFDVFNLLTGDFSQEKTASADKPDTARRKQDQEKRPVALGVQSAAKKRRATTSTLDTDKRLEEIVAKRKEQYEAEKVDLTRGAVSYAAVINQWYKTGDMRDLQSCYRTNTVAIIRRTVKDLPAPVAWKFLLECGNKLMTYPFIVSSITSWVRQIFHEHAAYILSQSPEKKQLLQPLQTHLQQRMTAGDLLRRLQGKVELLAHLAENRIARRATDAANQSLIQYKEGDEALEEEAESAVSEAAESEVSALDSDDMDDDDDLLDD